MVLATSPILTHERSSAEISLARLALDLGAQAVGGGLSDPEEALCVGATLEPAIERSILDAAAGAIRSGRDPLGDELLRIRPGAERRAAGAFYTPPGIVESMISWAFSHKPTRLVDAGCGSGRFAAASIRRRPDLPVVAIDLDPLATLLTRAALAVLGAEHASVLNADFTTLALGRHDGITAWVANPPYVRHHDLPAATKAWAAEAGRQLGLSVSSLSGLHTYFFLATALDARRGDVGTFITSAEWLNVGYGSAIRELLLDRLGGVSLHAFDSKASAFADVMTTAVIVNFKAGARPERIRLERVPSLAELGHLDGGRLVARETLRSTSRWSSLFDEQRSRPPQTMGGPVRLGQICRVHRGQVTGGNRFFVLTREKARELGLSEWCRPAITQAEEILDSGGVVRDAPERKVVLALPRALDRKAHPALDRYLQQGEESSATDDVPLAERYIAVRRQPWWHLGRLPAPPIVASYMARRAPAFALNPDGLVLLNIGHGLYPAFEMNDEDLAALTEHLNLVRAGFRGHGRTYHGGLEKFEPREMENLIVPAGERWLP